MSVATDVYAIMATLEDARALAGALKTDLDEAIAQAIAKMATLDAVMTEAGYTIADANAGIAVANDAMDDVLAKKDAFLGAKAVEAKVYAIALAKLEASEEAMKAV